MGRTRSLALRTTAVLALALLCALGPMPAVAQVDEEEAEEAEQPELDPRRPVAAQLREAVRRGDFRVARIVFTETDDVGHIAYGEETPGIACDGQLGSAAAYEIAWNERSVRFAAAYNEALLSHPLYSDPDVCVWTGHDRAERGWANFTTLRARPRDPAASVNRAARGARPELVRSLIDAGRPFDSHDRWYRRPLHWAARRGDSETIGILLAAGARLEAREPVPPLVLAVDSNRSEAVDRLLAGGASPVRCGRLDVRQSWGSTNSVQRQICPLRHAIERSYEAPVRSLVRAIAAGGPEARGDLAEQLLEAVRRGRIETVEAFLDQEEAVRRAVISPSVMRAAAARLDLPLVRRLIALGGGSAARTAAEERLWLSAAALSSPEPLALLVWFGDRLNYLSAAERAELGRALPTLTADTLRLWLARATEARERLWDSVQARDHAALEALVRAGADLGERHDDAALAGAAATDLPTVRLLLALGATAGARRDDADFGCADLTDDIDEADGAMARQQRLLASLCAEQDEARSVPSRRPGGHFSEDPVQVAVSAGKLDVAEALLPVSAPRSALWAVEHIVGRAERGELDAGRRALLGRLAAIAAQGARRDLPFALAKLLRLADLTAAEAMLEGYIPRGAEETSNALRSYDELRCGAAPFAILHRRGVPLSLYRTLNDGNLFTHAARCNSAEMVAVAATVSGLEVNHIDATGSTPLDELSAEQRAGPAGRALIALGGRGCADLPTRCDGAGTRPDPSL